MTSVETPGKKLQKAHFSSPKTPLKQGKRTTQKEHNTKTTNERDLCCLCCEVLLYGEKATFNLATNQSLLQDLQSILNCFLDLKTVSNRLCWACGRKIESLSKRNRVLSLELTEIRQKFNTCQDVKSSTKLQQKIRLFLLLFPNNLLSDVPKKHQVKEERRSQLFDEDVRLSSYKESVGLLEDVIPLCDNPTMKIKRQLSR